MAEGTSILGDDKSLSGHAYPHSARSALGPSLLEAELITRSQVID